MGRSVGHDVAGCDVAQTAPAKTRQTSGCGFMSLAARGISTGLMNKRNTRDLGLRGTGAGKGDADRSPGWRNHYEEINWPSGGKGPKKFRKVYGTTEPKAEPSPKIIVH